MKNTLIGIGMGILILLGLYLFHTNSVNKAYQKGLQDCIKDSVYVAGDTITMIDTVYIKPGHVKPKPKPYEPPDKPKYTIDTTMYFQDAGRVRVWSDDIVEGLYIEPIYYLEYNTRIDTIFINKIKYVEIPARPDEFYETPTFLITTGAIIGGTIVYFLRK